MKININYILRSVLLLLVVSVFSCKTSKDVTKIVIRTKPMGVGRIIKNIEERTLDFETLEAKRLNIDFDYNGEKSGVKGYIKIHCDSFIFISLSKMTVPVAKLLLTPEKIQMVNYIGKYYYEDGYGSISELLEADVNYYFLEAVLTNKIVDFSDELLRKEYRKMASRIENNEYVLQDMRAKKLSGMLREEKKRVRYVKRKEQEGIFIQRIFVDPSCFKISQYQIMDILNSRKLEINYNKYTKLGGMLFPEKFDLQFEGEQGNVKIGAEYGRFVLNGPTTVNFKIPEKYKRVESLK